MAEDEGRKSRFNAGVALTERIDALQRAINAARFNPIAMNMDTQTYNYMVMINANDGLLDEAWGKLSPDEKQKGSRIKLVIKDYVDMNPPIIKVNGELSVNKKNYNGLMSLLDIYCKMIKDFLDKHNLNAPDDEWDDEGL